jgi:hypothetical protein
MVLRRVGVMSSTTRWPFPHSGWEGQPALMPLCRGRNVSECPPIATAIQTLSTPASEHRLLTHADYFALEQAEDARCEYWRGDVFAMAGGSDSHGKELGFAGGTAPGQGCARSPRTRHGPARVGGTHHALGSMRRA